jgi:hypothetical protein
MERDMGTTLATKQDLLLLATREDLLATKQDFGMLRRDIESRFALLEQKVETIRVQLDQKIDRLRDDLTRDLAAQDLKMTVKLGSMLFVGFGLTIAAIRLWS